MQGAKRKAKVTKIKKGDKLVIEYVAGRTGPVVVKYPAGGTVRLQKSTSGLKELADVP
jgi:hypothetical protein